MLVNVTDFVGTYKCGLIYIDVLHNMVICNRSVDVIGFSG